MAASACLLTACSKPADTTLPGQDAASPALTGTPTVAPEPTEPGGDESVPSSAQQALLRAGETALAKVSGSTVVAIEREGDRGWEVEVVTRDGEKYELEVSADGREVLRGPQRHDKDPADQDRHRKLVQAAELDYRAAARKIAVAVPGTITELELDSERGKTVWEADVVDGSGTKRVVIIDAVSGEVLSTPVESRPTTRRPSPSTTHHPPHH